MKIGLVKTIKTKLKESISRCLTLISNRYFEIIFLFEIIYNDKVIKKE